MIFREFAILLWSSSTSFNNDKPPTENGRDISIDEDVAAQRGRSQQVAAELGNAMARLEGDLLRVGQHYSEPVGSGEGRAGQAEHRLLLEKKHGLIQNFSLINTN